MTPGEWIGMVVVPIVLSVIGGTWVISAGLAGLKVGVRKLEENVKELFDLWNERPWNNVPCEDHAVKLGGLDTRVKQLEKK